MMQTYTQLVQRVADLEAQVQLAPEPELDPDLEERLADAEEARDLAKARVEEFETQCDELETRCAKLVERADEVLDSFNELRKALHAILGLEGIDDPPAVDAVRAALRAHDDLLEGFSE